MYTVIILPVQVSFSLTNPDLHSVQFPAPGPEHVCLQDKWQAGEERGGRSIELVSRLFKTTRITSQSVSILMLCVPGPTLQLQATQNHVPLQRYFPGVFSQYVPSLHKEESSRHSFLSEDKHDIHMVSLALFPRPRPCGRKGHFLSSHMTWEG